MSVDEEHLRLTMHDSNSFTLFQEKGDYIGLL